MSSFLIRSESKETILRKSGVGTLKRRILATHLGKLKIVVYGKVEAVPSVHLTAYYPSGVTKESNFYLDGKEFDQPVSVCGMV